MLLKGIRGLYKRKPDQSVDFHSLFVGIVVNKRMFLLQQSMITQDGLMRFTLKTLHMSR